MNANILYILKKYMHSYEDAQQNADLLFGDIIDKPEEIRTRSLFFNNGIEYSAATLYAVTNALFRQNISPAMEMVDFAINNCPYMNQVHHRLEHINAGYDQFCLSEKRFMLPAMVDYKVFKHFARDSLIQANEYIDKPLIVAVKNDTGYDCSILRSEVSDGELIWKYRQIPVNDTSLKEDFSAYSIVYTDAKELYDYLSLRTILHITPYPQNENLKPTDIN